MAYLDNNGLLYLWNKIKSTFVKQVSGKGLSTNDYTTAEKNKLNSVATGAEVNQNAFSHVLVGGTTLSADQKLDVLTMAAGENIELIPDADTDKVTISATYSDFKGATTTKAGTRGLVPAPEAGKQTQYLRGDGTWQTPPDTKYTHPSGDGNLHVPATGTANGGKVLKAGSTAGSLSWGTLTKADVGLGNTANGAEVNQNAFSNIKVGSTTVAADSKTDTLELIAGSNVTLTPDATNDKVTIASKDTTYNDFKIPSIDEEGKSGLVPAPPAAGYYKFLTGRGWVSPNLTASEQSSGIHIRLNSTDDSETITDITIENATDEHHGVMSATDKAKLDGIATGANNYAHPKYTSKASNLYKVTVDGTGHVSATTTVTKSDITGLGIPAQDTTYSDFKGATSSAAGTYGLVPAPAAGSQNTKYLRADGTWQTPPDTKYTHPTGDGNLHVPATGATNNGKVLKAGDTAGSLSWGTLTKADVGLGNTANGAEINQNAFSNIKVGTTTITADSKTDTLELVAGNNITLTPDSTNDKVTITAKNTEYIHPSYTAHELGLYKILVGTLGHVSSAERVTKTDITALGIPAQDTTYSDFKGATANSAGTHGLVPSPAAGEQYKILCGDKEWRTLSAESPLSVLVNENGFEIYMEQAAYYTPGYMSIYDKRKLDDLPDATTLESIYAKKSDIVDMYKYKGSVSDASKLPTTGQITGDVYNIEAASAYGGAGMNVAWDGSKWDPLGEIFTITSITNAEIDSICK